MSELTQRYDFQNSERHSFEDAIEILKQPANVLAKFFQNNPEQFDHLNNINDPIKIEAAVNKIIAAVTNNQDTVTLYRGIILTPDKEEPDMEQPGMCWTYDYDTAKNFAEELDVNEDDPDYAPCVLIADFKKDDIDLLYSVAANTDEPDENEIRTYKDAKPVNCSFDLI